MVKELVQSIVKHSRVRNASIRLVEEGAVVRVDVADDGAGFETGNIGRSERKAASASSASAKG